MCPSKPNIPTVKNLIPQAPQTPAPPPDPIRVDKSTPSTKPKRSPLRIDLASSGGGVKSGANV